MKLAKKIVYGLAYILVIVLAFLLLKDDVKEFLQWWIALLMIGLTVLPMTVIMFRGFHDQGYLFAKPIGLALSGYLLWVISSLKLMRFTTVNCILCIIALLVLNLYILYYHHKKHPKTPLISKTAVKHFLNEELVFLLLLVLWCYIKGFKAEAYGTEKFMDYGFMASIMRSEYMPPYDMWYSGGTINYYYFGQYLATFLTKASSITVNLGYNLMLMTISSLSMLLPYSIVYNITSAMLSKRNIMNRRKLPLLSGMLGGFILSCSSNMHFPIFRWIVPMIQEMLGLEVSSYWFPDATRYIGYQPETSDKTIHEFPAYSTVLGDLHAHYINMIFVLTLIGLLFAWYLHQNQKNYVKDLWKKKITTKECLKEVCEPNVLMITFLIGMFHMTNFWDFPIYYVVSGAVILFSNAIKYEFRIRTLIMTACQGLFVILGSTIVALPFTLNFDQISTEIRFAVNHTPFYQLVILWGLPILIVIGFVATCILAYKNEEGFKGFKKSADFITKMEFTDLFVILLGLCAIGLVIMPEVIYVKDIYSGDYKRANTMFKLTYQSFIMFSMCSGYILVKLIAFGTSYRQKRNAWIGVVLSACTIGYMGHSIHAWFGDITQFDNRQGLDAVAFMEEKMPNDYGAVQWLNENISGHAVVLEADGSSYTDYERISAMTGLQTVAGWYVHEWLWRGDTVELTQRNDDVKTIYTSNDVDTVLSLIEQYKIDYIYVGQLEREKYGVIADDLLEGLGEIVYMAEDVEGSGDYYYIVKIDW